MEEEKMPDEMIPEEYKRDLLKRIKDFFEINNCFHVISHFLQDLSEEARTTALINETYRRLREKLNEDMLDRILAKFEEEGGQ